MKNRLIHHLFALGLMIAGSGSWLDAVVLEAFLALGLRARESDSRAELRMAGLASVA